MNRQYLKQTLKDQVVPFDLAVKNKLAYLNSDDVFKNDENNAIEMPDSKIEDAFDAFYKDNNDYVSPEPKNLNIAHSNMTSTQENQQSIQNNYQSISAKIAALRGISLPGDYLHKK